MVRDDEGNPLEGAVIVLLDESGSVINAATTAEDGTYLFEDLPAGEYTVRETNPVLYPLDVDDYDFDPDGDSTDSDRTVDNEIAVTLASGELDKENDFVDSTLEVPPTESPTGSPTASPTSSPTASPTDSPTAPPTSSPTEVLRDAAISGMVRDDQGAPLAGAVIVLLNSNGNIINAATTTDDGTYLFDNLPAGEYTVQETNPVLYPLDVDDYDFDPDGDVADSDQTVDNSIAVTLTPGELDAENDFVDSRSEETGSPAAETTPEPSLAPFASPTVDTCLEVTVDFDSLPDGSSLESGEFIKKQYSAYGIIISASGGAEELPRLFDSSAALPSDDLDLGSPNEKCEENPGPGVGIGGEPGEPGENCIPQGNVLIIQEDDEEEPNDREGGGMIIFEFQPNVEVFEIGLMDIEGNDSSITVSHLNPSDRERVREVEISGLGDNSVQSVPINRENVFQLKVNLAGSGAVTSLTICIKADDAVPTQTPSALATANPTNRPTVAPTGSPDESPIAAPIPSIGTQSPTDAPINDTPSPSSDVPNGSISGMVRDDQGAPLAGAVVVLLNSNGNIINAATTTDDGTYIFDNLPAGEYTVRETNPVLYPLDVDDYDFDPDGDVADSDRTVDNEIAVTLTPGELDEENDFVDSNKGSISGNVSEDGGEPLPDVIIELLDENRNPLSITTTDNDGNYMFQDVPPGKYNVKETNPAGFPSNVSDEDTTNDGDEEDSDTTVDDLIGVSLNPGEADTGNNFVDSRSEETSSPVPETTLEPSSTPGTVETPEPTSSPSQLAPIKQDRLCLRRHWSLALLPVRLRHLSPRRRRRN